MRKKSSMEKHLSGTYRPDRARTASIPMVLSDVPESPAGLSADAAAIWSDTAGKLIAQGMLSALDLPVLEIFSKTFVLWRSVSRFLEENGVSFVSDAGLWKVRPEATTLKELLAALDTLTSKLGLSIRDREKLTAKPQVDEPDQLQEFLNRGRAMNDHKNTRVCG